MKPAPHRPSDPFLGVTVLEDYRVVAHVRAEPRGDTYRALPLHTGHPVLVKLIAQGLPRDNSARATWARVWGQAERMPRIDHPNVERVLDCGLVRVEGAERFCVVTELLEGDSLQAHVRARGRLAVDEVLTVAQQIAQGLAAAHRVGLVHGDLRATNVTLVGHASNDGSDARVVLCDVGLTNLLITGLGGSPTLREMLCSPESIAPEQIRGEPTTPATDVYAFGVVLYRLLTGVAPFHADNTTQMLRAHLTRPVPAMRDRCQAIEVPPVLEALVRRCLAKRQEDRPHTIDTLLAGLQECEATVLSMSNQGTPSWIAPRPLNSLPSRAHARADADRIARPPTDSAPISIDALPDEPAAPPALPTSRGILPARAPSASDTPALPAALPAVAAPAVAAPAIAEARPASAPPPPVSALPVAAPPEAPVAPLDPPAIAPASSPSAPSAAPVTAPAIAVVAPAAPAVAPSPAPPPAPARAAPLALAAAAATLAAIYTLVARRPHPPAPAPIAAPAAAVVRAPTPAPERATVRVEVSANAPQASLSLRGRTYPLPIEIEIDPGREQEMIELSAAGHQTRRTWLMLDRTMRLRLDLDPAPPAAPAAPVAHPQPHPPLHLPARPAARPLPPARAAAVRPAPAAATPDPSQQWIQAHRADVAACATAARAAGLPRGARLVVSLTLKPSGRVRAVTAQTTGEAEAAAGRCLESAIRRWTFPPPRTPEAASVSFPVSL